MKKIKFESSEGNDNFVVMSFNQTNISETISKFFGFLRANGIDEDLIKTSARDILDGNWNSKFPSVGQNLAISPLTIGSLTSLTTAPYSTISMSPYQTDTFTTTSVS